MPDESPNQATLDTLLHLSLEERALDFQILDALDVKAGILLALDGLLIAVATQTTNAGIRACLIAAFVVAAMPGFLALRNSKYKQFDTRSTLNKYWDSEPLTVTSQLLGNLASYADTFHRAREAKGKQVAIAFWLTAAAIALLAAASFIPLPTPID